MDEPKFDTTFFERYAMITLCRLLGKRFANLRNADRPDLQDVNQSIGIEVTRAIKENKIDAELLVNNLAGSNVFDVEIDEADMHDIQQYGYSYGLNDNSSIGRLERQYWSLALPLKRIIKSKVHKVADGFYGDFRHFGLYIFSREPLSHIEVQLTVDYIADLQRNNIRQYSFLYIAQTSQFYVCNLENRHIDEFSISREQRRSFYRAAVTKIPKSY